MEDESNGAGPGGREASPGPRRGKKLGLLLKLGVFVFLAVVGLMVLPRLMYIAGDYMVAAALGTFAAAAVANALVLRIYERGMLADIGMHWNAASRRNLLAGIAGGAGSAALMLGIPLLGGAAHLKPDPDFSATLGSFLFVTVVLLFGAVRRGAFVSRVCVSSAAARAWPFCDHPAAERAVWIGTCE